MLDGKVIVITGGTRGFGLAAARALGRESAVVVVGSRSPEAVEEAVSGLQGLAITAAGFTCDVTDFQQVVAFSAKTRAAFGRFDAWVNNAGSTAPYGPSAHVPVDAFRRSIDTIVHGVHHGSVVALEHLLERGEGKLVNILGWGARKPIPYQNAYAASKAWVRNFTLALAEEYRHSGVGIYTFAPGMMPTELVTSVEAVAGFERRVKALERVLPAIGQRPEVAAARLVWLLSHATDGKTGLEVKVSSRLGVTLGFLRVGVGALLRRSSARVPVEVTTVPPAIAVPIARRR